MDTMLKVCKKSSMTDDDSCDDFEENDGFVMVRAENNASLVNCSNVVVGNELKGPINVEKIILMSKKDGGEDKSSNTEYNVGSIIEMFNLEGLKLLQESFKNNPRPDKAERDRLAQMTGTRRKMVRKWFAIERAKRKKELSMREPLTTVQVLWSYWSRKFKRKVKFLTALLVVYVASLACCVYHRSWHQFIAATAAAFLLLNVITHILFIK